MQASKTGVFEPAIRYLLIAFGGCLIALLTWQLMNMSFRFAVAVTGLIIFLSCCGIIVRKFEDFLLYCFVFNIPFSIFEKWYFLQHDVQGPSPGIGVGMAGILIILAYLMWFGQVFITKTKSLPKLGVLDIIIIIYVLGQLMSTVFAANKLVAYLDIIWTIKHLLIYFFIANNVKRRHLQGIVLLILFAIVFETGFAGFERVTGYVNLASTKGDTSSENFGEQYEVPGIEHEVRAVGTTNDSHTLGLYFAMMLPLPFVLLTYQSRSPWMRFAAAISLGGGLLGLVITFSRSGWLAFAIAAAIASMFIIFSWKQGKSILVIGFILFAASMLYPQAYVKVYNRVFDAPPGLLTGRGDLIDSAVVIWKHNLFFGAGPGNYEEEFHRLNLFNEGQEDGLTVHNTALYLLTEAGLFGFFWFYTILLRALFICWRTQKQKDEQGMVRAVALAFMVGIIAYISDGMTTPMYRATPVYMQLWLMIALAVAFERWRKEERQEYLDAARARLDGVAKIPSHQQ